MAVDDKLSETIKEPELAKIDVESEEISKDFYKHKKVLSKRTKFFWGIVAVSGVGIVAVLLIAVVTVFKLDTTLFPASLQGNIKDFADRPLIGVQVCISNNCATTDNTGNFSLENLSYGKYQVKAELQNYKPLEEEVWLQRGVNKFERNLNALGIGDLSGVLAAVSGDLNIKDLKLNIDAQTVFLNEKNEFLATGLIIGNHKFVISSPYYVDQEIELDLKEGSNKLEVLELKPAMDIQFKAVDWLTKKSLPEMIVKATTGEFKAGADGVVLIKDLEPNPKLFLTCELAGYNTRVLEIKEPLPGLLDMENLSFVRSGRVMYVSSRLGNKNIYSSNYDGSDEKLLTDNKGDNEKPMLLGDNKTVFFLSTRDNVKDAYGSTISIPYTVPLNGGKLSNMSRANYSDSGSLGNFSLSAWKRSFSLYSYVGGITTQDFYLGNLDGTDSKKVGSKSHGYVQSLSMTSKGEQLVFTWTANDKNDSGVYSLNPANGEFKKIYSSGENYAYILGVAADNKNVLIKVVEVSTYRSDLYSVSLASNKVQRITNTSTSENQARYGLDNNTVYYLSTRDEKSDIFRINLTGENEQRITNDGKVGGMLLFKDDLIFYTSEKNLYVLDGKTPDKTGTKVTENVINESYLQYDPSALGY